MSKELDKIKKYYGEKMMHMCREMFPRILEDEGTLLGILESKFAHNKYLASDIIEQGKTGKFKSFIYSEFNTEAEENTTSTKSAVALMREAGYILYPECQTEADIQSYKKYYAPGEKLCTFRDHRLNTCRVWFAVKENVADIRREDFSAPKRQDEYGTSVISIQFTKDEYSTLSIKNRYNHTVINPDNTFNNDLNNIIPGLADAFEKDYGVKEKNKRNKFKLDDYVLADGKYYHYNINKPGMYYCDNNVVIKNGKVHQFPTDSQILVENYLFDFAKKTITQYMDLRYYPENYSPRVHNSFVNSIGEITNMSYSAKDGIITIKVKDGEDVVIGVDGRNTMTSLYNANVNQIKDGFLIDNKNLASLSMPNLTCCGSYFLLYNAELKELSLPNLQSCGNLFLYWNEKLQELNLPKLESCGDDFLPLNRELKELSLPNLQSCGNSFLKNNEKLKELSLPNLESCGDNFLPLNEKLKELSLPNLQSCGNLFLKNNEKLKELSLPELRICKGGFLVNNIELQELCLPKLESCGDDFLLLNEKLKELSLPNFQSCGNSFLNSNTELQELSLPNLQSCGSYFLSHNIELQELNLSKLESCGDNFLSFNKELKELSLPNLQSCGSYFLNSNTKLKELSLPNLQSCGSYFLGHNTELQELCLPNLQSCGSYFLNSNTELKELSLPKLESCGNDFLSFNKELKELSLPNLRSCGNDFLRYNKNLQNLELPKLSEHGRYFLDKLKSNNNSTQNEKRSLFGLIQSRLNDNIQDQIRKIENRVEKHRNSIEEIEDRIEKCHPQNTDNQL